MSHNTPSRRRLLTSLAAATFAVIGGFASSSCASPRLPDGGYPLRASAGGYELQVLVNGVPAQTYEHAGENFVLGRLGARYTLRVLNHTARRIEAVLSVDGRDAIDGKPADVRSKRGYLVPAWGAVDVDGWRLSRAAVATFRFATVADSYVARTGSARDVGVIGLAVFPERYVPPPRPVYAPPPRYQPWPNDDERELGDASAPGGADLLRDKNINREGAAAPPAKSSRADSPMSGFGSGAGPSGEAARSPRSSSRAEAQADDAFEGPAPRRRPGLGTEFGEAMSSPVREVSFQRANASRPAVVLGVRYNDRDGLVALGIDVDGCCVPTDDLAWRQSATPFPGDDRRYTAPPAGWRAQPGWQDGCCVRY